MPRTKEWGPILLCGWPGLARLWYRGQWSGLALAIGFSILLNTALVASFLWPWYLGELFPFVAWPTLFLGWFFSARESYAKLPDLMSGGSVGESNESELSATLFNQAQREYLKGHWEEARLLLNRRLAIQPRDMESRLLLATTFRRSSQFVDALRQLELMERFDESVKWLFEINRERELIDLEQNDRQQEESIDLDSDDARHPGLRAKAG